MSMGRPMSKTLTPPEQPSLDIIVFPLHDWKKCQSQGLARRDTHIIRGLEKVPDVRTILLVDRPVSSSMLVYNAIRGESSFARAERLVRRSGTRWLWQLSDKLYVLDTVVIDPLSALLMRKRWWPHILENMSFLAGVRDTANHLGIERPVLWLFTPISAPAIGWFSERLVVFDAIDNWVKHDHMSAYRHAALSGYDRIRLKADIAFCNSKSMQRFLAGGRPESYWVPNGVDLTLFRPSSKRMLHEAPVAGKPRVGYAGAIDSRLDVDLLEQCATALPYADFVLVGPVVGSTGFLRRLRSLRNVYCLGSKRYEDMPHYINSFDVCVIPHKVNGYTDAMNPLKLYEYLACGKPVVSTSVAGVDTFRDVITIVDSPSSFVAAVKAGVDEGNSRAAELRDSVAQHSWANRLEFISSKVLAKIKSQ